ncbi:MAG: hypothetical protein M1355_02850 [Patescibacteria group bacterium]|nr:hypothetical protein [Patescibacteria group bacterium]
MKRFDWKKVRAAYRICLSSLLAPYKYLQHRWRAALDEDYLNNQDYNDDLPPMLCEMGLALVYLVVMPLLLPSPKTRIFGEITLGIWIIVVIFLTVEAWRNKRDRWRLPPDLTLQNPPKLPTKAMLS